MADLDNPDHWSISTRLPPNIPDDWKKEPLYASPPAVPGEVETVQDFTPGIVENTEAGISELVIRDGPTVTGREMTVRPLLDMETREIVGFQWVSVPLPEIEGGDKGDGWQKAVGWFFRNNAGDPWQFSTAEPEICYEKHRAYSDAQPIPEAVRYAERLAASLWEKHWKDDAPQWEPLSGDLIGVLTQIDNMTAGLTRKGDGWQTMDTAPKDGKHCILAVKEGPFIYSVQGAFQAGEWNAVHRNNVTPLAWMPNVRLPDEFRTIALTDAGKP